MTNGVVSEREKKKFEEEKWISTIATLGNTYRMIFEWANYR